MLQTPAAEQHFAPAQANLGRCYAAGLGVAKDETEATRWMSLSADQGSAEEQYMLGARLADGKKGLGLNHALAATWFRKAANRGNGLAQ